MKCLELVKRPAFALLWDGTSQLRTVSVSGFRPRGEVSTLLRRLRAASRAPAGWTAGRTAAPGEPGAEGAEPRGRPPRWLGGGSLGAARGRPRRGSGGEGAGRSPPAAPEQASCRRVRWLRFPPRPHDPRRRRASRGPQTKLTTWLPPAGKLLASYGAAGVPQLQVSLAWPPSRRPRPTPREARPGNFNVRRRN